MVKWFMPGRIFRMFRRRYYVPREALAPLVLAACWSLLSAALFLVFLGGGKAGAGTLIAFWAAYATVLVTLILVSSGRLAGPFDRLNTEIDLVLKGDYRRRLRIRTKDDVAIRNFVEQINRIIEELENTRGQRDEPVREMRARLEGILGGLRRNEIPEKNIGELLGILCSDAEDILRSRRGG